MMNEFVIGGAQERVPRLRPEAATVDEGLGMLDAEPDGEWFGFDMDAPAIEHLKSIPRAVADRQNHMIRRQALAAGEDHAPHPSFFEDQVLDAALKADLAAQGFDFRPQALHHLD